MATWSLCTKFGSAQKKQKVLNQNKDNEINLLTTDWARINRALDAEEDQFPQGGG